jgi:hypothetical protein
VQIAAIIRVEKFSGAFVTNGNVGRDENISLLVNAVDNLEVGEIFIGQMIHVNFQNRGARRIFMINIVQEIFQVVVGTLRDNFNVGAAIGDGADNFIFVGNATDKRTKTHALYNPENFYVEQNKSPPAQIVSKKNTPRHKRGDLFEIFKEIKRVSCSAALTGLNIFFRADFYFSFSRMVSLIL